MPWDGIYALIQNARSGDQDAWTDLNARLQPYLLGLSTKFLGPGWPERTASDLTQDVWLKFSQHIKDFRGGDNDEQMAAVLRAWFKQTMSWTFQNDLRYRDADVRSPPGGQVQQLHQASDDASNNRVDPPAGGHSPTLEARLKEQRSRVEGAIRLLHDSVDQTIVRNYFFDSRSLGHIANELDLTYDQVRYRLDKALAFLGEKLEESP